MKRLVWILLMILWNVSGTILAADVGRFTLEHNGLERSYEIYVPDSIADSTENVPLLIALHQYSSSARAMQLLTDLNSLAEQDGFIIAYPESTGFAWNNGTAELERGYFGKDIKNPDDVGYISALIASLSAEYPIDAEQVYLLGTENGGLMAGYVACQIPEQFAGIMIVGALMWDYQVETCPENPSAPVNLLIMHGLKDWFYPVGGRIWDGTIENPKLYTLSLSAVLEFWARRNGCNIENPTAPQGLHNLFFNECEGDVRTMYVGVDLGGGAWFKEGDYILNQVGISTKAILSAFMQGSDGSDFPAQDTSVIPGHGIPRSYRLYVPPAYDPDEAMPLVVALHGRPDTGIGFSVITQLHLTAARENFMVLYPDGIDRGWNYVRGFPNYPDTGMDDVKFLENLVTDLSQDINIDMNRVYVTGFSNGGFMTQRVACEGYDFFAAFAVLGATLNPAFDRICDEAHDVPIMFMHGTDDVSIPWIGNPATHLGVVESLAYWVVFNNCNLEPSSLDQLPSEQENPETFVVKIVYTDCAFGGDLWFYGIDGGGHNWAGVPGVIGEQIAGKVNTDIHASDVVWEYMSQFSLKRKSEE